MTEKKKGEQPKTKPDTGDRNDPGERGRGESQDRKETPGHEAPDRSDQEQAESEERRTMREAGGDAGQDPGGREPEAPGQESEPEAVEPGDAPEVEPEEPEEPETPPEKVAAGGRFPVVGVGASAGGLEALEQFVSGLPEKSGIAFVMVTHTHPDHPTRIPELLGRKSPVDVILIEDGMEIKPNTVYVPPSDKDAVIKDGVIRLQSRAMRAETHMPVDIFLRSLAEDRREAAGCVILSGTGTDGTGGLLKIKENAGVVVAQTLESARHSGMPSSAIETGMVDYVLEPSEMAERLMAYFQHPATLQAEARKKGRPSESLSRVLTFLADRTDHDFSQYKKSTLVRRIERRMSVNRCRTMDDYLRFLHRNPDETRSLFQDLLIGVTSFFRDPEVFNYIKEEVLPQRLSNENANGNANGNNDSFRVWVAGCATGEEAYSVAIIVLEAMRKLGVDRQLQIFATDIDPNAIHKARQGIYPKNIAMDVSKERLETFFTEEETFYRVNKDIRERLVFAEQNILRDPPFMHLEMLVCRNLLIYLEPVAQNKLIPLFHYNLKPGGILFLGSSESTGRFAEFFTPINKRFSVYKKRDLKSPTQHPVPFLIGGKKAPQQPPFGREQQRRGGEVGDRDLALVVEKKLLKSHTPACVIVNAQGEIVYFHGRTGKYLEHAPGKPNLRITEMGREGLRYALAAVMRRAMENHEEAAESGIRVKTNGDYAHIDLTVFPFDQANMKDHYMVLFNELPESFIRREGWTEKAKAAHGTPEDESAAQIAALERELEDLRENYRTTQEELETSNEELKSANEEMYSSNEELQSSNEELESSREELESLNEELSTVNSELYQKISEVQEAYSRITDVLNSTGIAILFLDNDLQIKRFTEEATRLINLIEKDVGRPLEHISHNLDLGNLTDTVRSVLNTLSFWEDNVRTTDGHWYRMRIMPHRTKQNVIEGVVITFINIDAQKVVQAELDKSYRQARQFAESIADTVQESLLVLDADKRVVMANRRFYETFGISAEKTKKRYLFDLGNGEWNIPDLRRVMETVTDQGRAVEDFEFAHHFETVGYKQLRLNAFRLQDVDSKGERVLVVIQDITGSQQPKSTD